MAAAATASPSPSPAAVSSSSSSYSLWFAPSKGSSVRAVLEREIATQAAKHGTATFEPHVTLLGDLRCPAGDAQALGREVAQLLGGKGGGSGRVFQGKAADLSGRAHALERLNAGG